MKEIDVHQNWEDSAWVSSTDLNDENNNIAEFLDQNWNGSSWESIYRAIVSYLPTAVDDHTKPNVITFFYYEVNFDGSSLTSRIYFYRMETGSLDVLQNKVI